MVETVKPTMLGSAQVTPSASALSGYTGSGSQHVTYNPELNAHNPYSRLVRGLLGEAEQMFAERVQDEKDMAYVSGAQQMMSGVAEDEIESNFLTKSWATAGYRDQEGKLALMDYKAKAMSAIESEYRAKSPQEFSKYLGSIKSEAMQYIRQSSSISRKGLLDKLLIEDGDLIQKQASAYSSFVKETELKTLSMGLSQGLTALTQAISASDYMFAQAGITNELGSLMTNERFEPAVRAKLATDFLATLAYEGQVDFARDLMFAPLVQTEQGMMSLADTVTLEERLKINKAIEAGFKQNKNELTVDAHMRYETGRQAVERGEMTRDEWLKETVDAVVNNKMPVSKVTSAMRDGANLEKSREKSANLATAFFRGDREYIFLNGSEKEAGEAFLDYLNTQPNMSVDGKLANLQTAGSNGMPYAYNLIGTIASPAIERVMNGQEMQENDLVVLDAVTRMLNDSVATANVSQTSNRVLNGIDDSAQVFMRSAMRQYRKDSSIPSSDSWALAFDKAKLSMQETPEMQGNLKMVQDSFIELVDENVNFDRNNTKYLSNLGITEMAGKGKYVRGVMIPELKFFNSSESGALSANRMTITRFNEQVKIVGKDLMQVYGSALQPKEIFEMASTKVRESGITIQEDKYNISHMSDYRQDLRSITSIPNSPIPADELLKHTLMQASENLRSQYSNITDKNDVSINSYFSNGNLQLQMFDNNSGKLIGGTVLDTQQLREIAQAKSEERETAQRASASQGFDYYLDVGKAGYTSGQARSVKFTQKGLNDVKLTVNGQLDKEVAPDVDWSGDEVLAVRKVLLETGGTDWAKDSGLDSKAKEEDYQVAFFKGTSSIIDQANMNLSPLAQGGNELPYKAFVSLILAEQGLATLHSDEYIAFDKEVSSKLNGATDAEFNLDIESVLSETKFFKKASPKYQQKYLELIKSIY